MPLSPSVVLAAVPVARESDYLKGAGSEHSACSVLPTVAPAGGPPHTLPYVTHHILPTSCLPRCSHLLSLQVFFPAFSATQTHKSRGPQAGNGSGLAKSVPRANCLGSLPAPEENLACEKGTKHSHTASEYSPWRHPCLAGLSHRSALSSPCLPWSLLE